MNKKELDEILEEHKLWLINPKKGKRADLRIANLVGANLIGINLYGANLSYANLSYANLICANLRDADLSSVDLRGANLVGANLIGANLRNANLSGANLNGADLNNEEDFRKGEILKESMIGYKKCQNCLVTLEIPKGAIVFGINGCQFRTNKAKCIEISNNIKIAHSYYDYNFTYEVGKEYEIDNFNLMYNVECESGIHFFKTKKEAKKYKH